MNAEFGTGNGHFRSRARTSYRTRLSEPQRTAALPPVAIRHFDGGPLIDLHFCLRGPPHDRYRTIEFSAGSAPGGLTARNTPPAIPRGRSFSRTQLPLAGSLFPNAPSSSVAEQHAVGTNLPLRPKLNRSRLTVGRSRVRIPPRSLLPWCMVHAVVMVHESFAFTGRM